MPLTFYLHTSARTLLAEPASKTQDSKDFAAAVAPWADITEENQEQVCTLRKKILIPEKKILSSQTAMRIEIYCRFRRHRREEKMTLLL